MLSLEHYLQWLLLKVLFWKDGDSEESGISRVTFSKAIINKWNYFVAFGVLANHNYMWKNVNNTRLKISNSYDYSRN